MTPIRFVLLAVVAAGSTAVVSSCGAARYAAQSSSSAAGSLPTSAEVRAAALARENPTPPQFNTAIDGEVAWAEAQRRAARIPLPEGGNFNGIEWAKTAPQLTVRDIEEILQYNAYCQWLRAQADGRDPHAARVLAYVPRWPGLKNSAAQIASVITEPDTPLYSGAIRFCRESLVDEQRTARRLRLDPPDG